MTLENHPASFANVSRGPVDLDGPPTTWTHDGRDYVFATRDGGWDVYVDDALLGRLEHDHPADERVPRHWRIRDVEHEGLGIGASWGDWRDAVIGLIDYRDAHSG